MPDVAQPRAHFSGSRKAVDFQLLGYVPALVLAVHKGAAQQEKVHLQVGEERGGG